MIKRGGIKSATVKSKQAAASYLDPSRAHHTLQILDGVIIGPSFTNSQSKPNQQEQLLGNVAPHSVHFQRYNAHPPPLPRKPNAIEIEKESLISHRGSDFAASYRGQVLSGNLKEFTQKVDIKSLFNKVQKRLVPGTTNFRLPLNIIIQKSKKLLLYQKQK